MIRFALKNGVGITVALLLVMIFGLVSLFQVPIQMTPDLTAQSVSVMTSWPGATPQDIEKEILIEQEKYLRSIPNLEEMTSMASTGSASITLEFRVGTDLDEILVRTQNALSQVPSYPENVDQPRLVTSSASDEPIAYFTVRPLEGNPQNIDIVAMQDFLEDYVQTEFERTPGVSQSELFGGAPRQVRIYVDPVKLAERDLTIAQLRLALRIRNRDISGGDFDEGKRRYLVRTLGRFHTMEDLESALIARRNGAPVYLRDVATVELSRAEQRTQVRHNGHVAVAMSVRRQQGTNIIEVMENIQGTVRQLNAGLMKEKGLIIRQVSDDTIYIKDAVSLVRQNLLIGAGLVTLMMLVFLRSFRPTLIGALAVPICTISAFLGLTITGRTINVISLAGVAFAIGMTVDNSIVVLENIDRHRLMGKGALRSAREGVTEVWSAVLASTLTTVFVFLPIVFVKEEAGQLFADIAIAITSAILASMAVAIMMIPPAAARILRPIADIHESRLLHACHELFGIVPIARRFNSLVMIAVNWLLKGVVRRVVLIVAMAGGAIFLALALMPQTEYLPDGRQNLLFAILIPPPGYNIREMTEIGKRVESKFVPYIDADPQDYKDGKADVPALKEFFFVSTTQNLFCVVKTIDPNDLDAVIPILNKELSKEPGMIGFTNRRSIFSGGISGSRGIEIDITGRDLKTIYDTALPTFLKAREVFGKGAQVRPDPGLVLGQPFLEIRPDWERAAELGVGAGDLGYTIWALTDGAFMDEFFLEDDKIDMFLYSTSGTVERTQDLEELTLHTAFGGTVPLSSVAEVVQTVNTETIRRVDRRRAVTVTVVPPTDIALEDAVTMVEEDVIGALREEGSIKPGVSMAVAGASDKLAATRRALGGNFILALAIAYLLMVALFEHWGYPFVIMMSVPLGILGGIVGLHLMNHGGDYFGWLGMVNTRQPLDVLTMMGFIILVGTVVNNPILIVKQALHFMRRDGMNARDAVSASTRTRIRPIMMSTMTTTFGLSPLVFIPGRRRGTLPRPRNGHPVRVVLLGILYADVHPEFPQPDAPGARTCPTDRRTPDAFRRRIAQADNRGIAHRNRRF